MIDYEETKSQPITKMGQMGKRLWEKEGISLSTYQIQRKSYSV